MLFLDELAEFIAPVIDGLRPPLEEGGVRVSRAPRDRDLPSNGSARRGDETVGVRRGWATRRVPCNEAVRHRYVRRVSGSCARRCSCRRRGAGNRFGVVVGNEQRHRNGRDYQSQGGDDPRRSLRRSVGFGRPLACLEFHDAQLGAPRSFGGAGTYRLRLALAFLSPRSTATSGRSLSEVTSQPGQCARRRGVLGECLELGMGDRCGIWEDSDGVSAAEAGPSR